MADTVYCSFCGNPDEIRKLVAGPGNFICNDADQTSGWQMWPGHNTRR
jgi:hypothetical protein